ncbi:MAG: 4-hydroxy-tetrahydrodipicolinate synthase, partial [Clostridia bacterium]|nr:4-hydroxy-tetrahydrodipicolinate synthase [Clostridia bacterium]
VGERAKVIIGCGSNSTAEASRKASFAEDAGADAILVVTPYYNKASREGMIRHFETVCRACAIPVIAYNVPSRTGCDLDVDICREISEIENVAGIKEASGSVSRAACLTSEFGNAFPVYSGCDEINLPVLSVGGAGIISVMSNVFPEECVKMCRAASEGDRETALRLYLAMYPFSRALFCEVNPIPVKTVMAYLGMCKEKFRLPLCKISEENRGILMREYRKLCEKLSVI